MSYNREARKAFIKKQTEYFAYDLYLNQKYYKDRNESAYRLLNSFLYLGWLLTEKEERKLIKEAIEIAKNKYNYDNNDN